MFVCIMTLSVCICQYFIFMVLFCLKMKCISMTNLFSLLGILVPFPKACLCFPVIMMESMGLGENSTTSTLYPLTDTDKIRYRQIHTRYIQDTFRIHIGATCFINRLRQIHTCYRQTHTETYMHVSRMTYVSFIISIICMYLYAIFNPVGG